MTAGTGGFDAVNGQILLGIARSVAAEQAGAGVIAQNIAGRSTGRHHGCRTGGAVDGNVPRGVIHNGIGGFQMIGRRRRGIQVFAGTCLQGKGAGNAAGHQSQHLNIASVVQRIAALGNGRLGTVAGVLGGSQRIVIVKTCNNNLIPGLQGRGSRDLDCGAAGGTAAAAAAVATAAANAVDGNILLGIAGTVAAEQIGAGIIAHQIAGIGAVGRNKCRAGGGIHAQSPGAVAVNDRSGLEVVARGGRGT